MRRRSRLTPFKAGLIGAIVIVLFSYAAYSKFANPFASPYTVHAVFSNANQLRPDSVVRIAGVNVGKVSSVSPVPSCKLKVSSGPTQQCSAADVTMTIDDTGLPLHKDASFWIRPRLFLEGNFFVDINPGTPEAPTAPDGYTFPISQGVEPVQFDQLLTSLQRDTRSNLQILLQQYGLAVKTAGPSYNKSIQYWTPAYQYGAQVSHDTLGTQPHDLSNWIDKGGVVNGALDTHPQNLKNLVTDLNTTALAFARQNVALSNAVAELPRTLGVAIPALNALQSDLCTGAQGPNCAPGPLRIFARRLIPGVVSTGPMVDASLPFFHQLRLLVQPNELGGLTNDLAGTIPALAKLSAESIPFYKNQIRPAANCQVKVILPWTHLTVPDQNFNASNGFPPRPVYVEGVDFLPGLAGESRPFDANGPYVRVFGNGGTLTYSLSPGQFGQSLSPISGNQPQLPAPHTSGDGAPAQVSRPPLQPNVPCETQPPITDLTAPVGGGPQPVATSVGGPAALARQQSAALLEFGQLATQAKQQGLSIRFSRKLEKHG
jgi:phospholipid/cholesterol/gamma-HCH transport system substrate-binding protein